MNTASGGGGDSTPGGYSTAAIQEPYGTLAGPTGNGGSGYGSEWFNDDWTDWINPGAYFANLGHRWGEFVGKGFSFSYDADSIRGQRDSITKGLSDNLSSEIDAYQRNNQRAFAMAGEHAENLKEGLELSVETVDVAAAVVTVPKVGLSGAAKAGQAGVKTAVKQAGKKVDDAAKAAAKQSNLAKEAKKGKAANSPKKVKRDYSYGINAGDLKPISSKALKKAGIDPHELKLNEVGKDFVSKFDIKTLDVGNDKVELILVPRKKTQGFPPKPTGVLIDKPK